MPKTEPNSQNGTAKTWVVPLIVTMVSGVIVGVIVSVIIGEGHFAASNTNPPPTNVHVPPTPTIRRIDLTSTLPPTKQPPTAVYAVGATRVSEEDGMVMVYVPAGEFLMGSTDADIETILAGCKTCKRDLFTNEQPQHKVYLDAFWIDKTEVTNAQYKKCVQAGVCKASQLASFSALNGDTQPVVGVDWNDAQAYCQRAGRKLPTEAQWEKAARGTDGRIYPWGNQAATCEYAVMNDGSENGCGKGNAAWPIGSKLKGASPYGALDMMGNVWEWVADWYSESYYAGSPPQEPTRASVRAIPRSSRWFLLQCSSRRARCAPRQGRSRGLGPQLGVSLCVRAWL